MFELILRLILTLILILTFDCRRDESECEDVKEISCHSSCERLCRVLCSLRVCRIVFSCVSVSGVYIYDVKCVLEERIGIKPVGC